jgi:hypothetical protein
MNKRVVVAFGGAALATALGLACSSPGRAPFSPIVTDSGADDSGGSRPDATAKTDSGADASRDGASDAATMSPPLCGKALSLAGASTVVGVRGPFSLAEDELTVAWVSQAAGGAKPIVHIGKRADIMSPFQDSTLDGAGTDFAFERPVLNPQGSTLAVLRADRRAFVLFARADANATFLPSSVAPFTQVNAFTTALAATELLHDPVWAPGGRTLLFGVEGRGIFAAQAVLGAEDFGAPSALSTRPELLPSSGKRRRPSGTAPDNLLLFYFDEVTGESMAAGRTTGDYTSFTKLGAVSEVQARAACKRLYFFENGVAKVATQP